MVVVHVHRSLSVQSRLTVGVGVSCDLNRRKGLYFCSWRGKVYKITLSSIFLRCTFVTWIRLLPFGKHGCFFNFYFVERVRWRATRFSHTRAVPCLRYRALCSTLTVSFFYLSKAQNELLFIFRHNPCRVNLIEFPYRCKRWSWRDSDCFVLLLLKLEPSIYTLSFGIILLKSSFETVILLCSQTRCTWNIMHGNCFKTIVFFHF